MRTADKIYESLVDVALATGRKIDIWCAINELDKYELIDVMRYADVRTEYDLLFNVFNWAENLAR